MFRSHQAIGLLVVAVFGLWGCSRAPSDGGASVEKLKAVETKLTRLEDDFRAAASARDQLRKKLTAAEEAQVQFQTQMNQLAKDVKAKDDLIQARTTERDQMAAQYDQFRKGLKELMTRAEEALAKPENSPTVPAISTSRPKPADALPEVPVPTDLPSVPAPPK